MNHPGSRKASPQENRIETDDIPLRNIYGSPFVICVFAVGFTLRIILLLAVPVGGPSIPGCLSAYNDEAAHASYILYILEAGRLPGNVESIQEQNALSHAQFENYQPPLFYWGMAIVCRVIGCHSIDAVTYAGRAACFLIWMGLVLVMFGMSRRLALNQSAVETIIAFLSLNGVFVRYTVTLSNDALFWFFAGCAILVAVTAKSQIEFRRPWIAFGLIAILGLYTKLTFLLLLPLVMFIFNRTNTLKYAAALGAFGIMVFLLTFPVWLRNIHEFGGFLPISAGFGPPQWQLPSMASLAFVLRSLIFPWSEFWQGFLGLLFFLPAWALVAWSLYSEVKTHRLERQPILVMALFLSFLGFLWLNLQYYQAEARYLFAAWPALCIAFCRLPIAAFRWIFAAAMLLPYGLFLIPSL